MFIVSYQYRDNENDGWNFSEVNFRRVNLFVGATGSGKSRFLNTIFNISSFVHNNNEFRSGIWTIKFKVEGKQYEWEYKGRLEKGVGKILHERLWAYGEDDLRNEIFLRDENSFVFNQTSLPKLPRDTTAIFLLKDEENVAPVHAGFGKLLRRNFFGSDLQEACAISNLPQELLANASNKEAWEHIFQNLALGAKLYLLRETSLEKYNAIVNQYKDVFPTIENIDFTDGSKIFIAAGHGKIPILTVKEKGVFKPVMLHHLSSGMQKVLLIISDVITMSEESVYIIDEYENSLGINAISFLPDFLSLYATNSQFIITSHHPYLINKMPIANWQVFHRDGSNVSVVNGTQLEDRYGKSKQEAFIQLINDPIYNKV